MRRLLIAIALIAPWAFPAAPASAGWKIDRATAIARIVWHHPCVDRMQIRWESAASALEQGKVATVAVAWADEAECAAVISTDRSLTWPELCTHVLHEAGHLARYRDPANVRDPDHSLDPASVMYGEEDRAYGTVYRHGHAIESGGDPRCADRGRPFLRAHQSPGG